MRWKTMPTCKECGKEIIDDICLVLDRQNAFQSCVCLDCRDRLQSDLQNLSQMWEELLMPLVDGKEQLTPELECELIDAELAAAYG